MAQIFELRPGTIASIVRSSDDGPIRRIPKSSATKPTGTFISVKAGYRAMPWESMRCELPTIELCEIATPVVALLAQPHRLELRVRKRAEPLIYFPDLELEVETDFYEALMRGEPFGEAALTWRARSSCKASSLRKLVIEVKDDDDPRLEDRDYAQKLKLASEVYAKLGICFRTIVKSKDLSCVDGGMVRDLTLERLNEIAPMDVHRVMNMFPPEASTRTLGEIVQVLGGDGVGSEIASTLHVHRIISIDLRRGFRPDALVSLPAYSPPSDLLLAA
jgi:hypothetical protein